MDVLIRARISRPGIGWKGGTGHTYIPASSSVLMNGEGEVVVGMWETLDRTTAHFLSGSQVRAEVSG